MIVINPYFHSITLDGDIEGVIKYINDENSNLDIRNSKNLTALANLICELAKFYRELKSDIKNIINCEKILLILLKHRQGRKKEDNKKNKKSKKDIEIYYLAQLYWSNRGLYEVLLNDPKYLTASQSERIDFIRKKLEEISPATSTKEFVEKLIEMEKAIARGKMHVFFQEIFLRAEQEKIVQELVAMSMIEEQIQNMEKIIKEQKERFEDMFTLMYELVKTLSDFIPFDKKGTIWEGVDSVFNECPSFSDIKFSEVFKNIINPNIQSLTLNEGDELFKFSEDTKEYSRTFLSNSITGIRVEKDFSKIAEQNKQLKSISEVII